MAQTLIFVGIFKVSSLHNPGNAGYTGKVIQVQEDGNNVGLRVNVTKNSYGYEDTMFVQYDKSLVSDRVLEDDIITAWGNSMGLLTYKTVLGGRDDNSASAGEDRGGSQRRKGAINMNKTVANVTVGLIVLVWILAFANMGFNGFAVFFGVLGTLMVGAGANG